MWTPRFLKARPNASELGLSKIRSQIGERSRSHLSATNCGLRHNPADVEAQSVRRESAGLALLACVVLFNFVFLAPELRIGRFPPNDNVLHLAAAERLGASLAAGEPFLDPWVSEWSLGFPFWRSYQPLPHLIAAGVLGLAGAARDHATVFALLQYLFIAFLPISVYAGARMLGLAPVGAGLGAILCVMPSSWGEYGRYGLGYGATTWRGSGLFTQAVALHFLSLSIGGDRPRAGHGQAARRGRSPRGRDGPLPHRIWVRRLCVRRAARVGWAERGTLATSGSARDHSASGVVASPLVRRSARPFGRGDQPQSMGVAYKWDSLGAPEILREISHGRFFDAGRFPVLTIFVLIGAIGAAFRFRETLPRRLLALTVLWLALYFGRATWGHLLLLLGIPPDLHLHRLQAAFELSAVLLAAWGIVSTTSWLAKTRLGKRGRDCDGGCGGDRPRRHGQRAGAVPEPEQDVGGRQPPCRPTRERRHRRGDRVRALDSRRAPRTRLGGEGGLLGA